MRINLIILVIAIFLRCEASIVSLAQGTVAKLPNQIIELLFKDLCARGCTDEEAARWKSSLKYEAHDLNGDSVPEFFVFIDSSDWCGAGSNCDYWVFQKREHGYVLLLNDKELQVKAAVTNGYHDLASETPVGFCGRNVQRLDVTPYKFRGKKYRAQRRKMDCRAFTPPVES